MKMKGHEVPVAARIERIDSMSAHADRSEIMRWLGEFVRPPSITYLVHGEPDAAAALAEGITATQGWRVHVAQHEEQVRI